MRTSAICANVFKSGCAWLLHHFDTVAGSLCNVFANHLLIIPLSANMVLTRFKSAILQLFVVFAAKLLLLTGNKEYIHIRLPKRVLFSQMQGIFVFKNGLFMLFTNTRMSSPYHINFKTPLHAEFILYAMQRTYRLHNAVYLPNTPEPRPTATNISLFTRHF